MNITLFCECGIKIIAKEAMRGRKARCPKCKSVVAIPLGKQVVESPSPNKVRPALEDPAPKTPEPEPVAAYEDDGGDFDIQTDDLTDKVGSLDEFTEPDGVDSGTSDHETKALPYEQWAESDEEDPVFNEEEFKKALGPDALKKESEPDPTANLQPIHLSGNQISPSRQEAPVEIPKPQIAPEAVVRPQRQDMQVARQLSGQVNAALFLAAILMLTILVFLVFSGIFESQKNDKDELIFLASKLESAPYKKMAEDAATEHNRLISQLKHADGRNPEQFQNIAQARLACRIQKEVFTRSIKTCKEERAGILERYHKLWDEYTSFAIARGLKDPDKYQRDYDEVLSIELQNE